jgi:hypothetical protein
MMKPIWIVIGLIYLGGIGIMPQGWALELGDYIQLDQSQFLQGDPREKASMIVEEKTETETIRAWVNDKNQVYAIQIQSQSDLPPCPLAYMGEYGTFDTETLEVLPLRGKVIQYTQGNRKAQWRVSGTKGDFSAQAMSYDLAPSETED